MGWILVKEMGKRWNLKKILKELLTTVVMLLIISNVMSYIRKPTLDSNLLPTQTFQLIDGTSYSAQKGKPLIVHFWATWCPTCKLEASNIERLSKKYEVLSIAVNSGDDVKVQHYMDEKSLDFKVCNDKNALLAKQFHVKAYPTTFIYDANATLQFTEVGYTSTAGLLARMKLLEL